jgi:hypothetical protein
MHPLKLCKSEHCAHPKKPYMRMRSPVAGIPSAFVNDSSFSGTAEGHVVCLRRRTTLIEPDIA